MESSRYLEGTSSTSRLNFLTSFWGQVRPMMCRKQPNNPQILISDKLSKFPVSGWASGGYVDCATTISWTPAATVALYCLVVQLEESWCIVEEKPYNIDICPTILGHCVRCGVHNHCNGDTLYKNVGSLDGQQKWQ